MAAAVKGWREPREERERRIALSALPFEEEASFFPRFARSSLPPFRLLPVNHPPLEEERTGERGRRVSAGPKVGNGERKGNRVGVPRWM